MTEHSATPTAIADGGQEGTAEITTTVAQDGDGSNGRLERLDAIVEMVYFLRDHPDVPLPYEFGNAFNIYTFERPEFVRIGRLLEYAEKDAPYSFFVLRRRFGPVSLEVNIARERVCQRIVTGTRTIPSRYEPEHTEEIVEWKCDDPLLAGGGE